MRVPNPRREIRLLALRSLRGANFWSTGPVTRLDLAVGAYDEISSADVPGVTESLLNLLPGLAEHRCNIGEPGGFVTRLRRGTYAPHIIEHIALELQTAIGQRVGYGRTRGGDRRGEYTVVFEHRHSAVGLRAAELALAIVRRAFGGEPGDVDSEIRELADIARVPEDPAPTASVLCGVTGGAMRGPFRRELALRLADSHGVEPPGRIVEIAPDSLLEAGLPYGRSEIAVITDLNVEGLPERFRRPERLEQLLAVVADGVRRDGWVVVPATGRGLREMIKEARRRVAVFAYSEEMEGNTEAGPDGAGAFSRDGRIILRFQGAEFEAPLHDRVPAQTQVAAALTSLLLSAGDPSGSPTPPVHKFADH